MDYRIRGDRERGFKVQKLGRPPWWLTVYKADSLAECVKYLRKKSEENIQKIVDNWVEL